MKHLPYSTISEAQDYIVSKIPEHHIYCPVTNKVFWDSSKKALPQVYLPRPIEDAIAFIARRKRKSKPKHLLR